MNRYQLAFHPRVKKHLTRIPDKWQEKIQAGLETIAENPYLGKKLKGKYAGFYTYRVWPYRIIYEIFKNELIVYIIDVDHQGGVYG